MSEQVSRCCGELIRYNQKLEATYCTFCGAISPTPFSAEQNMEVRHSTDLKFTDISSEQFREYKDGSGVFYRVDAPLWLAVSASGNHRVLDTAGQSHAIDLKARCGICWKVKDDAPHFVR